MIRQLRRIPHFTDVFHLLLALAWVGLGVSTWLTTDNPKLTQIAGPIVVGVLSYSADRSKHGLYYILGFILVAQRVLDYLNRGVWTPLFVWLLVLLYLTKHAQVVARRRRVVITEEQEE